MTFQKTSLAKNNDFEVVTALHEQRKNKTKYNLVHIRLIKIVRAIYFLTQKIPKLICCVRKRVNIQRMLRVFNIAVCH